MRGGKIFFFLSECINDFIIRQVLFVNFLLFLVDFVWDVCCRFCMKGSRGKEMMSERGTRESALGNKKWSYSKLRTVFSSLPALLIITGDVGPVSTSPNFV